MAPPFGGGKKMCTLRGHKNFKWIVPEARQEIMNVSAAWGGQRENLRKLTFCRAANFVAPPEKPLPPPLRGGGQRSFCFAEKRCANEKRSVSAKQQRNETIVVVHLKKIKQLLKKRKQNQISSRMNHRTQLYFNQQKHQDNLVSGEAYQQALKSA